MHKRLIANNQAQQPEREEGISKSMNDEETWHTIVFFDWMWRTMWQFLETKLIGKEMQYWLEINWLSEVT